MLYHGASAGVESTDRAISMSRSYFETLLTYVYAIADELKKIFYNVPMKIFTRFASYEIYSRKYTRVRNRRGGELSCGNDSRIIFLNISYFASVLPVSDLLVSSIIESTKSSSSEISCSLPVSFSVNRWCVSVSASGSSSSSGVELDECLGRVAFCLLASRAFDSAMDSGVSRRPEDSIRNVSGHLNFDLLPCLLL